MPPFDKKGKVKDYYFIKLINEGTRNAFRFLPNQELAVADPGGKYYDEPLTEDLKVVPDDPKASERAFVNAVFVIKDVTKKSTHYRTSLIYPVVGIPGMTKANPEMLKAFSKYCDENGMDFHEHAFDEEDQEKFYESVVDEAKGKTLLDELKSDKKYNPPTPEEDGFIIDTDKWYYLLRNIKSSLPTMLIGHTGVGKTELVKLAAKKLGLTLETFDMGSTHDPASVLLGVHRLQKGASVFDPARFTKVIAKKDTLVLLDELSRASGSASNILLPCLDKRRTLYVEMAGTDELRDVPVHPSVAFIATANLGNEYSGTQMIDRALQDRFLCIELEYLSVEEETKLLTKRCSIPVHVAKNIATNARSLRNAYDNGKISTFASTRAVLEIGNLVRDGFLPTVATKQVLLPLFDKAEREVVTTTLVSR